MRGLWVRRVTVALLVCLGVTAVSGSAFANGNPPPSNPATPTLRPLPAGEPVVTGGATVWHNSLSCASDTEQSALSMTSRQNLHVACYGPPVAFPDSKGGGGGSGTVLTDGSSGVCDLNVFIGPSRAGMTDSSVGWAYACNFPAGGAQANVGCCGLEPIGFQIQHPDGSPWMTFSAGREGHDPCEQAYPGGATLQCPAGAVTVAKVDPQRGTGMYVYSPQPWPPDYYPGAPAQYKMFLNSQYGYAIWLTTHAVISHQTMLAYPGYPLEYYSGGAVGGPPGHGLPTTASFTWMGDDGGEHVLSFCDSGSCSERFSQTSGATYPGGCTFNGGLVGAGFMDFSCELVNPTSYWKPFTIDASRGMVGASFVFGDGMTVQGTQTEPGEPHGWPAYIDPAMATSTAGPLTPFSRFGPALPDVPKGTCDVASWTSVPDLSNYPAVTAGESVVWTLTYATAGARKSTIKDIASPSSAEISSTSAALTVTMPAFVYATAVAAGGISPAFGCVNADGVTIFAGQPMNGSGPCLGGSSGCNTPSGSAGPVSLSECLSGAGFGVSPGTWLPALASLLGCVARVLFVPSSWSSVAHVWDQIRTRAPFSFVYEAVKFLPGAASALGAGLGSGSCVTGPATYAQIQADPAAAARAPCSLGAMGGSNLAVVRTATLAIITVMLSLGVLRTSMRVLG